MSVFTYVMIGVFAVLALALLALKVIAAVMRWRLGRLRRRCEWIAGRFREAKALDARIGSYPDEMEAILEDDFAPLKEIVDREVVLMNEAVRYGDKRMATRHWARASAAAEQAQAFLAEAEELRRRHDADSEKLERIIDEVKNA